MAEIPASDLKEFCDKHDLEQLVIVGRKTGGDGKEVCSSYGVNREHSEIANDIANFMKYKVMGWKK